jgi:hypothetical protein
MKRLLLQEGSSSSFCIVPRLVILLHHAILHIIAVRIESNTIVTRRSVLQAFQSNSPVHATILQLNAEDDIQ